MRLLRNREVRRGLLLLTGITAALCAVGWAMAGPCCAGLLLVSGAASAAVYLVSARAAVPGAGGHESGHRPGTPWVGQPDHRRRDEGELAILSSEIRKMTVRLRQAADSQHRERMQLADAMADISHQLRTPLTAINLTLSMLGREGLPEQERRALLQELRRLVTRMEWLVETLLKMSRIDAGAVSFREESCRAADIIRRAVQPLAVPMELRGITLETAAGEECFTGDAAWSAEALGNVLKNCMEHAASYIRVSARRQRCLRRSPFRMTGRASGQRICPGCLSDSIGGRMQLRPAWALAWPWPGWCFRPRTAPSAPIMPVQAAHYSPCAGTGARYELYLDAAAVFL